MDLTRIPQQIGDSLPETARNAMEDVSWQRMLAAGTLAASAVLLFSGRRKSALALAAGAAGVALLEYPEAAKEIWTNIPRYIRSAQDFFVKAEDLVEQVAEQGQRLRSLIAR